MNQTNHPGNMQERKHQFALAEIQGVAFDLFLEKGYDGTTVDEIAAGAGISRRTFFRYYETKEDVVMVALSQSGEFLESLISQRPADEPPLVAFQRAMRDFLSHYQAADPKAWRILDLIQSTPRLRARYLLERQSWMPQLTRVLSDRATSENNAEIAAITGLAILAFVYDRWQQNPDIDVGQAVIDAFETLQDLLGA